jgi:hypothetical protein
MPDIREYADLDTAASDPRVPYSAQWLRVLARDGRIEAEKYGTGRRAMWLIHMPSLLAYVEEMKRLGPQKFVR